MRFNGSEENKERAPWQRVMDALLAEISHPGVEPENAPHGGEPVAGGPKPAGGHNKGRHRPDLPFPDGG